jgi:chromosome segregation ATPase
MGADDWARATCEVDTARTSLDSAEQVLTAVADRLRMLDEVRADPQGRLDKARFTLRDAQRLVVDTGQRVAHEIPTLDALAARLDRAPELLAATHPDYWSYLQELDAVARGAQDSVTRVRERIAAG